MKRFAPVFAMFAGLLGLGAAPMPLFDGKSLAGWEGDPKVWRIEEGVIVGGSMAGNPRNRRRRAGRWPRRRRDAS
ncbi:MAG: hypothetical protein ACKOY8_06545 [Verrucomicrobiota bacterium]